MPFRSLMHEHWQPKPCAPADIPESWRAWVLSQDSLTAQLKSTWDDFHVQLLQQSWQVPAASECQALAMDADLGSIREVLLHAGGRARVFARSVIPKATSDVHPELLEWGNRSLGARLFEHPQRLRGVIEVDRLPAAQFNAYLAASYGDETAWARRSVFFLDHQPLLVSEVFLPDMFTS